MIIDSLKSCEVCGIIAVRSNICKVCDFKPWNLNNEKSKVEYLKQKQIEHFEYKMKNKIEIKRFSEPEHGFKADSNGKLYI